MHVASHMLACCISRTEEQLCIGRTRVLVHARYLRRLGLKANPFLLSFSKLDRKREPLSHAQYSRTHHRLNYAPRRPSATACSACGALEQRPKAITLRRIAIRRTLSATVSLLRVALLRCMRQSSTACCATARYLYNRAEARRNRCRVAALLHCASVRPRRSKARRCRARRRCAETRTRRSLSIRPLSGIGR